MGAGGGDESPGTLVSGVGIPVGPPGHDGGSGERREAPTGATGIPGTVPDV